MLKSNSILKASIIASVIVSCIKSNVFKDVSSEPKYEVQIQGFIPLSKVDHVLEFEKTLQGDGNNSPFEVSNRRIIMNGGNENFLCDVPVPRMESEEGINSHETLSEEEEFQNKKQGINKGLSLVNKEKGKCLFGKASWWTYKFCYQGSIEQYHEPTTPEERVQNKHNGGFKLGNYEDLIPVNENIHTEMISRDHSFDLSTSLIEVRNENDKNRLVERWGGGDICDLTNKPRTVEVIYECFPDLHEAIIDVKELSSCNYQFIINTPSLCEEPFYTEKKVQLSYQIRCSEIVKDEDLERRQKEEEEKEKYTQAKRLLELEEQKQKAEKTLLELNEDNIEISPLDSLNVDDLAKLLEASNGFLPLKILKDKKEQQQEDDNEAEEEKQYEKYYNLIRKFHLNDLDPNFRKRIFKKQVQKAKNNKDKSNEEKENENEKVDKKNLGLRHKILYTGDEIDYDDPGQAQL